MTVPADWAAWADERPTIPRFAHRLLQRRLGRLTPNRSVRLGAARLPASRVSTTALAALREAVGPAGTVSADAADRARHAGGQALVDVLRRRSGDASAAPDALVSLSDPAAIPRLFEVARKQRLALVPWGGGTSVVGGLDAVAGPQQAVVAVDLSPMDRLLSVDTVSLVATFEPGIRTPAAEAALARHGLTLGHLPQSYERASLGGYVVTRSAGQASSGVGRIDDLLVGARLVTPSGELTLPALPGSAAGPDLRRLVLGSEGTLGILTEVTVRVRRIPAGRRYEAWVAPSWQEGQEGLRSLAQDGRLPDVLRLSDPQETWLSMALGATPGWQRRAL